VCLKAGTCRLVLGIIGDAFRNLVGRDADVEQALLKVRFPRQLIEGRLSGILRTAGKYRSQHNRGH
jgi:hypothetical protein